MDCIGGAAAVGGRIGERADKRQVLKIGARPAVGEQERCGIGFRLSDPILTNFARFPREPPASDLHEYVK